MDLKTRIIEIGKEPKGFDLFGVAPVSRFADLPDNQRPERLLPEIKSVIVLGIEIFEQIASKLTVDRKVGEISFREIFQNHTATLDRQLDDNALRIARLLRREGYKALPVPRLSDERNLMGLFPFKIAAQAAGIGHFGLNNLIITPEYGPRVRLIAVLTSAEMDYEEPLTENLCDQCQLCINNCPPQALSISDQGKPVCNRFLCNTYHKAIGGCSLCLSSCPK